MYPLSMNEKSRNEALHQILNLTNKQYALVTMISQVTALELSNELEIK